MKGRSTTQVSIRLPDEVVEWIRGRCGEYSVAQYIQNQIVKSYGGGGSACAMKKEVLPVYDWHIHKGGEKVRRLIGKEWVEMIAPELDGDGHPMNWQG